MCGSVIGSCEGLPGERRDGEGQWRIPEIALLAWDSQKRKSESLEEEETLWGTLVKRIGNTGQREMCG